MISGGTPKHMQMRVSMNILQRFVIQLIERHAEAGIAFDVLVKDGGAAGRHAAGTEAFHPGRAKRIGQRLRPRAAHLDDARGHAGIGKEATHEIIRELIGLDGAEGRDQRGHIGPIDRAAHDQVVHAEADRRAHRAACQS